MPLIVNIASEPAHIEVFDVKLETTGVKFTTIVSVNVSTLEQPFNAIRVTFNC